MCTSYLLYTTHYLFILDVSLAEKKVSHNSPIDAEIILPIAWINYRHMSDVNLILQEVVVYEQ